MTILTLAPSTPTLPRHSEGDAIELMDGRLLVVYMEFGDEGSDFSSTRIVAQESADRGQSWGRHRVITETLPGDVNVFSPNLARGLDGSILLIFMRKHSKDDFCASHYLWRSTDEGASFQPVVTFAARQPVQVCNAVLQRLASGRLLLPVFVGEKYGPGLYQIRGSASVLYSDDDGQSWQASAARVALPMRGAMEPHVAETRDGRVLMVVRNQLGSLFISESRDDGLTWSKPQTTGLSTPESCPCLCTIPATGDLLMIWNHAPYEPDMGHYGKRTPLSAAVSADEGRTWRLCPNIESDPRRAFSNPGCRFTRDGLAVINYWSCEYTAEWRMQHKIELRLALLPTSFFYGPRPAAL